MKKTLLSAFVVALQSCILLAQGTWTSKAAFPGPARVYSASFAIGTKGYISTGNAAGLTHKDLWEYDQASDTWTRKADIGGVARYDGIGFSVGTKGYIGGGKDANAQGLSDFWAWDQATDTWSQIANNSCQAACSFTIGSKAYVCRSSTLQEYDPASNTWTNKANMPSGRSYAVGFSIGTKGYVGTGYTGSYLTDFWEWDQPTNTWVQKASLPGPGRCVAAGFSIGTKGYIGTGGGVNGQTWFKDFYEWDQATNTWTQKADCGFATRYCGQGFNLGNYGYIGTGNGQFGLDNSLWQFANCNGAPAQPGAISGPASICENTTNTYSVTAVAGALSYTWTLPNGWSGTSVTNSISATAGLTGGTITVTANNACGSSTPRTKVITVNNVPVQPGAISGPDTICANTTNTYSITAVNGATGYTWTLPNGWTGSSNTTSIVATANATSGTITVTADNACGSGTAQTLAVTVNTAPATPGAISGQATICENSTNTYSVSAVNGATSYTWTLPNGWSGTSTTNSISATANGSSGNITVTATNSCGTSQAQTLSVMVNPVYVINTTAAICQGDSMLLAGAYQKTAGNYTDLQQSISGCDSTVITALTINPLPTVTLASQTAVCADAAAFNLTGGSPAGGTYSGTGVSNNQFDPAVAGAGTHTITYTYTDANTGCSNSATNTIVVNPLPPVPTITANGNTFTSSSATGNQWYMNGNPVNGATNQTFTCTGNGNYSVCVTDANGCKSCSQVLNFTTFGIAEDQTGNTVTVYPNPFNTLFTVIASEAKQSTVIVYNTLGEVIYSNQLTNQPLKIDLSEAPAGVYFVRVRTEEGEISKRIVKN